MARETSSAMRAPWDVRRMRPRHPDPSRSRRARRESRGLRLARQLKHRSPPHYLT